MTSFSSSDTNNSNNNNVTENENVNENDTVTTTSLSSSSSSCSFHLVPKPESLTPKRCEQIVKYARKRLQCTSGGNIHTTPMTPTTSTIPTPTTPSSMRIITHSQLQLGTLLGEGAFSLVYEVQSVKKHHRDFMLKQQENIVVKFLRAELYDNHGLFAASAADIVKEGNILSTLCHVNVIRLHAISSSLGVDSFLRGGGCYHDGYFLVLEKLTQTLTTRIQEWQGRHTQLYTEYNSAILWAKQQQQQKQEQKQEEEEEQQDNGSVIANTTPSVPSWRKRILLYTLRKNNRRGGSSSSLSLLSSTSDDVSISSIASSSAAFTSDYFADDDADADADADAAANVDADDDADHCCADWNTTTSITTITKEIEQLVQERIDASLQLAEAIHYLTTQHVMHRDLKPDNIGFDHQGILKVFDFDIARRCVPPTVVRPIPPTRNGSNNIRNNKSKLNDIDIANTIENQTFQYTHKVGSLRYMSPECAKREGYNLKTDVYSFALLFHQLLTLQKPYDDLEDDEHDHLVFYQGVRPVIPSELPLRIQQLLKQSWSPRISTRPTMQTICHILKEERKEVIRVGTPPSLVVSSSSPSLLLLSSMSYVSSCSFTAVSDINKKKEKEEKKKNTILFNININSTTTSSSNNNGSKKKHKGQQRRRFLRPSSFTLFRRNSGGSSTTEKNNGPTKILNNNKLASSSSPSYHHHGRRITHNNSNVSNAKAA